MDTDVYRAMAATERTHWWFVGRRAILQSLIEQHIKTGAANRILEAGCGTGGNLELLSRYGDLDAFELDDAARAFARERSSVDVRPGHLPEGIGRFAGPYQMIALFDVLEHIRQDEESLRILRALLAPEGQIIITVPALQLLWSNHDVRHHHHRRYSKQGLRDVIEKAGLQVDYISYFNFFLLPIAVMQRLASRLSSKPAALDAEPPKLLNRLFTKIFASERALLSWMRLPIGLSLCAICSAK